MNGKKYYTIFGKLIITLSLIVTDVRMIYAQQEVQFTQYMFNGLVINPAYAGVDEALSLTFIQRKQWANIENAPSTQSLSAHTLFKKKQLGIGFTLVNDKIGVHRNLSALTNIAYHLKVADASYVSVGLQAGINNRRSNYGSLADGSIVDPKLSQAHVSYTALDLGMGIYFRSSRLHLGLSAPELLPERFSIYDTIAIRLNTMNIFLFGKYRITLNENFDFEPSLLLKYFKDTPLSFDLNMAMIFRKVLTLGLSYRKSESVDFMFKGQITPQLQLGYSYDHPLGAVARMSNGSHELMVNYVFRYIQKKVISPR